MVDLPSPSRAAAPVVRDSAFRVRMRRVRYLTAQILSNPATVIGSVIILAMFAMAIFAPWLTAPNTPDPYQMPRDWAATRMPPGTPGYLLGTTNEGGDVMYGVIWGARMSLQLSLVVVGSVLVIGCIIGSLAGFIGGKLDEILMRIVDVFLSIPELIFALAIAAVLGPSFGNIMFALAMVMWVKYARIMRARVIQIKNSEYIDAARIIGDSKLNIYLRDILPNSFTPVMVQATLDMGNVVLIAATLSFI